MFILPVACAVPCAKAQECCSIDGKVKAVMSQGCFAQKEQVKGMFVTMIQRMEYTSGQQSLVIPSEGHTLESVMSRPDAVNSNMAINHKNCAD